MKLKFDCDAAALRRIKECAQAAKTFDCGELELFGLKQAVITKVNHTAIAENIFQTEVELVAYFKPKKLPFTPDIQYLINLDTKEHTLWDGEYPGPGNWQTVEADEDGFIRHEITGKESPIAIWQIVEHQMLAGGWGVANAGNIYWGENDDLTIIAYKPIVKIPESLKIKTRNNKNYDEIERVLTDDAPTIKETSSATTNELINRLEAAHAASVEFPDLVEQLRSRLAKIGLFVGYGIHEALSCCGKPSECWEPCGELGKSEAHVKVSDEPEEDLTNLRNWKHGCILKCVVPGDIYFSVGNKYEVEELEGSLYITDEQGAKRLLERNAYRFELFSKPKG